MKIHNSYLMTDFWKWLAVAGASVFLLVLVSMMNKAYDFNEKVYATSERGYYSEIMTAKIITNLGSMEIELNREESPKTVDNFIKLAKEGFYDGVRFHRIIKDFMVQTGDPLSKDLNKKAMWGTGGPGYKFEDEKNDLTHTRGALSMANSGPNTNGSQFFIVTAEATPWLDGVHTIFGKVKSGMDVLEKIESAETDARDVPLEDIFIQKIELGV